MKYQLTNLTHAYLIHRYFLQTILYLITSPLEPWLKHIQYMIQYMIYSSKILTLLIHVLSHGIGYFRHKCVEYGVTHVQTNAFEWGNEHFICSRWLVFYDFILALHPYVNLSFSGKEIFYFEIGNNVLR